MIYKTGRRPYDPAHSAPTAAEREREIRPPVFAGTRFSGELGANLPIAGVGLEAGGFYAPPDMQATHHGVAGIFGGVTYSPVGITSLSGNINVGSTTLW